MLQTPAPTPPELPQAIFYPQGWWETLSERTQVILVSLWLSAATLILWPLMRAIGRRIEGGSRVDNRELRAEVEQLRLQVAEMDTVQHRLAEMEERLEFAERLLAQQREAGRVGPG